MSSQDYVIDVENLSKTFGRKKIVDNISIKVPRGKVYGFLGPNGSGKTTTIRMMCGLITPDSGGGKCLGYDILTQAENIRVHTGYMTQKFSFWEDLTIKENLEFVVDVYSIENKNRIIDEALERLGLQHRKNQLAGSLSGGWKQRLALAACTLHKPQLLLLDEPTAGVDPKARREFWDEIHKFAAEGLTVLVSTHYMDEAERCHKIIYIAGGRLMIEGTVEEVIEHSRLITWVIKGENLSEIQAHLNQSSPEINVAPFGGSLHVSGTNEKELESIIKNYLNNPKYKVELSSPSMEDAFIHYMSKAKMENIL